MFHAKWIYHLGAITFLVVAPIRPQNRQSDDAVGPLPPGVALRSTSRLVELSVVLHDPKGRPVRDLNRTDFSLTDEGRPCRIAIFHAPDERPTPPIAEEPQRLVIDNRTPVPDGEEPSAPTIILFDTVNLRSVEDALYAKRELMKFLKNLHPGDRVALYALEGPTVRVLHDFSDDPQSLLQVAGHTSGALSQWLSSPTGFSEGLQAEKHIRSEWTIAALEGVAQHVAGVPGRKTLVWISSAFPVTAGFESTEGMTGGAFSYAPGQSSLADAATSSAKSGDIEQYRERLQRLARAFENVDLAIYPVDPTGLATDSIYRSSRAGKVATTIRSSPRLQTVGEKSAGENATMDLVASATGGRAFYNSNALGESVQAAFNDSLSAYVLGFYPGEGSWDGKSHKLMVQVNRPGVEVLARRSYFAGDPPPESELERDLALQAATSDVLSATAVGVKVSIPSNPLRRGVNQIQVSVDQHDLSFEKRNGKWHADFDLILVQKAPDGRVLSGKRNRCVLDRVTFEEAQTKGLSFDREVVVESASSLLVLVRDSLNGAIGSVAVPIDQTTRPKVRER